MSGPEPAVLGRPRKMQQVRGMASRFPPTLQQGPRIEQIRRVPCVDLDRRQSRRPADSVYLVSSKPECGYRGTADESRPLQ